MTPPFIFPMKEAILTYRTKSLGKIRAGISDETANYYWRLASGILNQRRFSADRLRVFRKGQDLSASVFHKKPNIKGNEVLDLDYKSLLCLLYSGGTGMLESFQLYCPYLRGTLNQLRRSLSIKAEATAFFSFCAEESFGLHSDSHDVFAIQLDGCKDWNLRSQKGRCFGVLQPGDLLYLPQGHVHNPVAVTGRSLHITIALKEIEADRNSNWASGAVIDPDVDLLRCFGSYDDRFKYMLLVPRLNYSVLEGSIRIPFGLTQIEVEKRTCEPLLVRLNEVGTLNEKDLQVVDLRDRDEVFKLLNELVRLGLLLFLPYSP